LLGALGYGIVRLMASKWLVRTALLAPLLLGAALGIAWALFPSDRTPKGAYYRVVVAVNERRPESLFPYLETAAQHAAFTIHQYSKDSLELVRSRYPKDDRQRQVARLEPLAAAAEGPGVFRVYAERFGWLDRLRRDLSGVQSVEVKGERATVQTVRGSRYAFRRRDNGMWGLTMFTGRLVADAQKAARDYSVIEQAAKDYGGTPPAAAGGAGAGGAAAPRQRGDLKP
jgi:hypothetical protein